MVKKTKGAGRPTKGKQGRTAPLAIRIEPRLRAVLDKAAAQSGGTLTDEVHRRLRMSFNYFGGDPINYERSRLIAKFATELSKVTGKSWATDPWTFEQFGEGLFIMLGRWDPAGPDPDRREPRVKPAAPYGSELPDQLGEVIAGQQLALADFTEEDAL